MNNVNTRVTKLEYNPFLFTVTFEAHLEEIDKWGIALCKANEEQSPVRRLKLDSMELMEDHVIANGETPDTQKFRIFMREIIQPESTGLQNLYDGQYLIKVYPHMNGQNNNDYASIPFTIDKLNKHSLKRHLDGGDDLPVTGSSWSALRFMPSLNAGKWLKWCLAGIVCIALLILACMFIPKYCKEGYQSVVDFHLIDRIKYQFSGKKETVDATAQTNNPAVLCRPPEPIAVTLPQIPQVPMVPNLPVVLTNPVPKPACQVTAEPQQPEPVRQILSVCPETPATNFLIIKDGEKTMYVPAELADKLLNQGADKKGQRVIALYNIEGNVEVNGDGKINIGSGGGRSPREEKSSRIHSETTTKEVVTEERTAAAETDKKPSCIAREYSTESCIPEQKQPKNIILVTREFDIDPGQKLSFWYRYGWSAQLVEHTNVNIEPLGYLGNDGKKNSVVGVTLSVSPTGQREHVLFQLMRDFTKQQ